MVLYCMVHPAYLIHGILHKMWYHKMNEAVMLTSNKWDNSEYLKSLECLKTEGIFTDIINDNLMIDFRLETNETEYKRHVIDFYESLLKRYGYEISDFDAIYCFNEHWDGQFNLYLNIKGIKYYWVNFCKNYFVDNMITNTGSEIYRKIIKDYKAFTPYAPYAIPILRTDNDDNESLGIKEFLLWDEKTIVDNLDSKYIDKILMCFGKTNTDLLKKANTLLLPNSYTLMDVNTNEKLLPLLGKSYLEQEEIYVNLYRKIADYFVDYDNIIAIKSHPQSLISEESFNKLYDNLWVQGGNAPFEIIQKFYKYNNIYFKKIIALVSTSLRNIDGDFYDELLVLGAGFVKSWLFYDSIYISIIIKNKFKNTMKLFLDHNLYQIKQSILLTEWGKECDINLIDSSSKTSNNDSWLIMYNCILINDTTPGELEKIINNVGKNTNILFLNLNHTNLYFNNNLTNRILAINLHKDVTGFERTGYFHDEVIYAYCGTYDFYQKVRTFTHERVMKHQGYTLRVSVSDAMFELNNRALLLAKPKEIKVPVPSPTPAKKPESKQVTSSQPKDNLRELLHNFITARIDISLSGSNAKLEILNISDKNISYTQPNCINENGNGHILESSAFKLDFEIKAVTSGDLSIHFRGVDVREGVDNTIRVPYWIDYKSIKVDGKELLKQTIPTWYEQILPLNGKVNAGDTIKLHVEWEPHKDTRKNIAI